jgi:hypothetical protein
VKSSLSVPIVLAALAVVAPGTRAIAPTDMLDFCNSTFASAAGVHFVCPQGDGDGLAGAGLTITITVIDQTNVPIPGIPPEDIWLIGCNDLLTLCGGSASINATAPTDANGTTTITGTIATGGCDTGLRVVVQGVVLGGAACPPPHCLPIDVRSPDQKSSAGGPPDGIVTASDHAFFGISYQSPPKPYLACNDFAAPYGTITLADFAKFGVHFGHSC